MIEQPRVSPGDDPASTWQRILTLLLSTEDLGAVMVELAELGAAAIGPATACGITSRHDGRLITVGSSDDRAARLDESQYSAGSGPCLHAFHTGRTVSVPDLTEDDRWPAFLSYARGEGLRCSLSIPLTAQGVTVGAMNFYAFHSAMVFDYARQEVGATFAAQASGALELMTRNARNRDLVDHLEQALTSRSVIDRALGVVMATEGCTDDQAFAILRARSQNSHQKLRAVASEVVEQVVRRPDRRAEDTIDVPAGPPEPDR